MKVTGLDGREYTWNLSKFANNHREKVSAGHEQGRKLLKEMFPFVKVLEEVTIPGPDRLYADFYINTERLMVEVQGVQHTTYNSFFFPNKAAFYKAQARDRKKVQWCELNDITIIQLFTEETLDEWRTKVSER